MPRTKTEARVIRKFQRKYGKKRGKNVFFASVMKKKVRGKGIPTRRQLIARRRRRRR